jgi:hypothetical protein
MAKSRRESIGTLPHQPTISPALALKRLQKLLDQIPEIRAGDRYSASLSTWQGNLKIVLSELYGENSLVFKEFDRIWFSPAVTYKGQPESDFVRAFNSGVNETEGFLKSRITDLLEQVEQDLSNNMLPVQQHSNSRRIFVVHGHDHGTKETVARYLRKA